MKKSVRIIKKVTVFLMALSLGVVGTLGTVQGSGFGKIEDDCETAIVVSEPSPYDPERYPKTIELEYNFSFSEPEILEVVVNETIYHRVIIEGVPTEGDVGAPLLPMKPVNVLLPQMGILRSITVMHGSALSLGYGFNVELGKKPIIPGQDNLTEGFVAYDPTVPYPLELSSQADTFDFRGYELSTFLVYPVQYRGDVGELYYYEYLTVTLLVTLDGSVSPCFRGLPEDEELIEAEEDILDDYEMIHSYTELPINPPYRSSLVDPAETYKYVIITNNSLKNAGGVYTFQTLRDMKNSRSIPTTIVTVEDIYACYTGVDEPEQIRKFIKDAYWGWHTDYVLLGGDTNVIPVRYLNIPPIPGILDEEEFIPSDLYYACLNGNFNFDGDERWGEVGDLVDLRAEVYIGRACVESSDELSNFTMKTIAYMECDDAYIEEVLMAGEHSDSWPTWGGDYMDELIDWCFANGYVTFGIPSDKYHIQTVYDREWQEHGWPEPNRGEGGWPKSEIITRINGGVHIINHAGHGNNYHVMKLDEPVVMRHGEIIRECHDIVENLTNEQYCMMYSQACLAGAFDNKYLLGVDLPYDCIAEYCTVKTNHGAFAVITNARYGIYLSGGTNGPSQHFQRQFWDAIYRESQWLSHKRELGPANQDSRHDNLWRLRIPILGIVHRYCYYEITLFGDPQVAIKKPIPNPGYIEGYVYDTTHQPIISAVVSTDEASDTTDEQGFYRLTVEAGIYDVTASKGGFVSVTEFDIRVSSGETVIQDFSLPREPTWVSPTGHVEGDWIDEADAYDENNDTAAGFNEVFPDDPGWTDPLVLILDSPITISGFRINAKKGIPHDFLKVQFYDGTTHRTTTTLTSWLNHEYEYIDFEGNDYIVDRVKIQIHTTAFGFLTNMACIYEFDFWEADG